MGKSDPHIFSAYKRALTAEVLDNTYHNACFLGNINHNSFTANIKSVFAEFHDLHLNGWNINNLPWKISNQKFDFISCTRCAYFSKDPELFFSELDRILSPGGRFIVDWGLGDHWRFNDYKIGWKKNGEHEHAYDDDNFLWSTIWHESFLIHPEFTKFQNWVKKLGYESVEAAIEKEVPVVFNLNNLKNKFNFKIDMITLWEDAPQIYFIMTGIKK
jgi:SAM-dependent methyltransferase